MFSGIKHCCRNVAHRFNNEYRAVFCRMWILPIRLITLASLFGHLIYRYFYPAELLGGIIIFIHISVALSLLNECRRSEEYHKLVEEFERMEHLKKE